MYGGVLQIFQAYEKAMEQEVSAKSLQKNPEEILNNFYAFFCNAHWGKNQLFIQKLPRIWFLKNVNFVKNKISERQIL